MPKKPPIRSRSQVPGEPNGDQTNTPEYRAWLSRWKEWAVDKLPAWVPPEVRIKLRQDVETALAPYGPADGRQEILDIVDALSNKAKVETLAEGTAKIRAAKKQQLLTYADCALSLALNRVPATLVGKPGTPKRQRMVDFLRPQLRQDLADQLTGEESPHVLLQRVEEWVASWVIKENPNLERREFLEEASKWTSAGLGGVLALTLMHPRVRDGIARGARTLGERIAPYEPFLRFMADAIVTELSKKPAAETGETGEPPSGTHEG